MDVANSRISYTCLDNMSTLSINDLHPVPVKYDRPWRRRDHLNRCERVQCQDHNVK